MNRHRAYWSAMGPGEKSEPTVSDTPTEAYYYELLKPKLQICYSEDSFRNLILAVTKLKEELNL